MSSRKGTIGQVISHWFYMFEGFQESPKAFYAAVEDAVKAKNIPGTQVSRVVWKEGGVFSANREYLRIRRQEYFFDVCGAPYGNDFFVSWWLGTPPLGCLAALAHLTMFGPLIRVFVRPMTYYRIDTATMFQTSTHHAILEVIDGMTAVHGLRALSESERTPIMKEFFGK